jgi:hypothetical protein
VDDASSSAVLEGNLGMNRDWEVWVQNLGGGFYKNDYLSQRNFNYNKSS